MESTFVMVKPPHSNVNAQEVLWTLDRLIYTDSHKFDRVLTAYTPAQNIPRGLIELHYAEYKEKHFYPGLIRQFQPDYPQDQKLIVMAVYEGNDIVQRVVEACGDIDRSNTVRGMFCTDSYELAEKEDRALQNVVHRSDSVEAAKREIEIFGCFLHATNVPKQKDVIEFYPHVFGAFHELQKVFE